MEGEDTSPPETESVLWKTPFATFYRHGPHKIARVITSTNLDKTIRDPTIGWKSISQLPSHPGVMQVTVCQSDDRVVFMDRAQSDLFSMLWEGTRRRHSARCSMRLCKRIIQGVLHLHKHGLAHRDVKPENIVIGAGRQPQLIDFDAVTTQRCVKLQDFHGTVRYAPATIFTQQTHDPFDCDVYATCIVIFEILNRDADWERHTKSISMHSMAAQAKKASLQYPDHVVQALYDCVTAPRDANLEDVAQHLSHYV